MFKRLMALAKQGDFTIAVRVAAANADQLTVIVMPIAKEGQDPALAAPIRLTGTPDELDENFEGALDRFVGGRGDLLEQLAATEVILKEATSRSAKKGTDALKGKATPAKAATTGNSPAAQSDTDSEDDLDQGEQGTSTASPAPAAAPAGTDAGNLFAD